MKKLTQIFDKTSFGSFYFVYLHFVRYYSLRIVNINIAVKDEKSRY